MNENGESERLGKFFAHYKIQWKITNFCLTIKEICSRIYSPEFHVRGNCLTGWKMFLLIGPGTRQMISSMLTLERLSDSGPDEVFVNWKVILVAGNYTYEGIESRFNFKKQSRKEVILPNLETVLLQLEHFTSETLTIQCNMIVRSYEPLNLNQTISIGVKCLSEDLKNMLHENKYGDVLVEVDGKRIKAHKCLLSRSSLFYCMIAQNPDTEENVIRLTDVPYEEVRNAIDFIYSGDMDLILSKPTISMYKFLRGFGSDALMRHFAPEDLSLHTNINVKECFFPWIIRNFSRISECIYRPLVHGNDAIKNWLLRFNPFYTLNNRDFLSIVAKVVEGVEPQYCCWEFAIVDIYSERRLQKRTMRTLQDASCKSFEYLVAKDELESLHLMDDMIQIDCRVRSLHGEPLYELGTVIAPTEIFSERTSYEELSSQMENVLKTKNFYDMIVRTGNEDFPAHKSVLSARSSKLCQMIDGLDDSNTLVLNDIEPFILCKFITFIYRGVLNDCEFVHLVKLYELAATFCVKGMLLECTMGMKEKINDDNRSQLLDMVSIVRDKHLSSALYKDLTSF